MTDYIAVDSGMGKVVARYRQSREPSVPDGYSVKEVDDVANHPIEADVDWFPDP